MEPSLSLLLLPTVASWAWAPSSCWSFPTPSFWSLSGNVLQETCPRHLSLCQLTSLWFFCFSLHACFSMAGLLLHHHLIKICSLWLCYYPCVESCHLYTEEQRHKSINKKIAQKDILFQILLTTALFWSLKTAYPVGPSPLRHLRLIIPRIDSSSAILYLLLLCLWSIRPLSSWEM